jgi:hypothetical protein
MLTFATFVTTQCAVVAVRIMYNRYCQRVYLLLEKLCCVQILSNAHCVYMYGTLATLSLLSGKVQIQHA